MKDEGSVGHRPQEGGRTIPDPSSSAPIAKARSTLLMRSYHGGVLVGRLRGLALIRQVGNEQQPLSFPDGPFPY